MFGIIVDNFTVNLVGEKDQRVLAREIDDSLKQFTRINGTCGVVWIDHDKRLGLGGDLRFNIG